LYHKHVFNEKDFTPSGHLDVTVTDSNVDAESGIGL